MTDLVLRVDAEHADVDALRDAYGKMQGFISNDNRSWIFWGEVHGFNRYDCWHHSAVGPGRGTEFVYDLFLPWHRAYLASFDHIAREQNPAAILPWWDWTSTAAHDHGLPGSYTDADAGGQSNPLASAPMPAMGGQPARRTARSPGDPSDLPSMTDAAPQVGLNLSVDDILGLSQFSDFSGQLQNVHDYVHSWVSGDMGIIATSAFDPIFWAHHAMIDRLWYLWQLKWGINNIPPDYLDKTLAPFNYVVRDVLDIHSLGYDYGVSASVTVSSSGNGNG